MVVVCTYCVTNDKQKKFFLTYANLKGAVNNVHTLTLNVRRDGLRKLLAVVVAVLQLAEGVIQVKRLVGKR